VIGVRHADTAVMCDHVALYSRLGSFNIQCCRIMKRLKAATRMRMNRARYRSILILISQTQRHIEGEEHQLMSCQLMS